MLRPLTSDPDRKPATQGAKQMLRALTAPPVLQGIFNSSPSLTPSALAASPVGPTSLSSPVTPCPSMQLKNITRFSLLFLDPCRLSHVIYSPPLFLQV
jgi:hypothetical protein